MSNCSLQFPAKCRTVLSSKDLALKVLHLVSCNFLSCVQFFLFFPSFSFSFLFYFPQSILGFFESSPSLFGVCGASWHFVTASLVTETYYVGGNVWHWSSPIAGELMKSTGDVTIGGQSHTVAESVVWFFAIFQSAPSVLVLFLVCILCSLGLGLVVFMLADWLLLLLDFKYIYITLLLGHLLVLFRLT